MSGSGDKQKKYSLVYRGTVCEDVPPSVNCSHLTTTSRSVSTSSSVSSLEKRFRDLTAASVSSSSGGSSSAYLLNSSCLNADTTTMSTTDQSSSCSHCQSLISNEYLYTDTEQDITLLERHYPPSPSLSLSSSISVSRLGDDFSRISGSVLPHTSAIIPADIACIDDSKLRHLLAQYGDTIGPITDTTRKVYLLRLMQWQHSAVTGGSVPKPVNINTLTSDFSPELHKVLDRGLSVLFDQKHISECNEKLSKEFDNPAAHIKLREGRSKMSFNYLLLDPRISRNLPNQILNEDDSFRVFIHSIFYIGKGKQDRPYAHFYDASKANTAGKMVQRANGNASGKGVSSKISRILDIWSCGLGVVSLHVNHNIIPVEAYTREAAMIDAVTVGRLTNAQRGNYYGDITSMMSATSRRWFGVYSLYRAMKVLLADGERQIRPHNL